MLESLEFYAYQILTGCMLGSVCAVIGVVVVLQRKTVFTLTLSQATTLSIALFLAFFTNETDTLYRSGNLAIIGPAFVLMLPFLTGSGMRFSDTLLIGGMLAYAALAQIVIAVASGPQSHLLQAYFGDILFLNPEDFYFIFVPIVIALGLFIIFFRRFITLTFDSDHARLMGFNTGLMRIIFHLILITVASISINAMGSFLTIACLSIPAFVALSVSTSLRQTVLISIILTLCITLAGFMISLIPIAWGQESVHFPTGAVILVLAGLTLMIPAFFARRRLSA